MGGARELHVAVNGDDGADGTTSNPLRTIQAAAELAQPGDVITVGPGTYRERIDPPRGGESESKQIIYKAAAGAEVAIKGSEVVKGWEKLEHDTWKLTLPNRFFGDFNPYADEIRGDWFRPQGRKHHTGAVYRDGHWLVEAAKLDEVLEPAGEQALWFGRVDKIQTSLWAQFPGVDPNEEGIEINVRQSVFYPSEPGRNFITVRGFTLEHAATNWAPPTAEQVGLIGTHWSKGWIIEDNTIRYSVCTGVTLGKHGDEFDNTSANSAEGYVETIKRGLAAGWSKEKIGSHVVRRNHISHCEQAGIVGSLGPAFSVIEDNHIHDIHIRQLFGGAEMAGIKFHGAIDTLIRGNHIHRCVRGIWLDWMTQGTRVTRNLVHDCAPREDLFVEVNHGPFLVDHNLFLSKTSLADWSEGGAYVHNLFAGKMIARPEPNRETPWQEEHGTAIAGLATTQGGDNRFYNNVLVAPAGLDQYDDSKQPNRMAGNLVLKDAEVRLREEEDGWTLELEGGRIPEKPGPQVTSDLLGKTLVSGQGYVRPDGSPYRLDRDYFGTESDPLPGPFAGPGPWKVWP
ncbi:right-handed parallel beta-helix repeat-containing protein [Haloferula sp. A504]|uniref:right-handed parallel beta-helix repeat-containing protein n=1 Tax=Haloferula sp. A504 TaxID=3373601 RepID=UPI0031BD6E99|nr:right-handed parallel beta-helix repeat-containing protein [Verrucomicrobiaceae bacterium E54]